MKKKVILNRLFGNEFFLIKALDGGRIILKAKDTFSSCIDYNFKEWGLNKPGKATTEIAVKVDEIVGNGTFLDIFNALPGDSKEKLLTQDQIIEACEIRKLFQHNSAMIFFTEKIWPGLIEWLRVILMALKILKPQIFVVYVTMHIVFLYVNVYRLKKDYVSYGSNLLRVVSPQLLDPLAI